MDNKMNQNMALKRIVLRVFCVIGVIYLMGITPFLPWFTFVIPLNILGIIFGLKNKDNLFTIGFLAGFITWFSLNYIYFLNSNGVLLHKTSSLVQSRPIYILLLSGLIGGVLSGLSLYTGSLFINQKHK
jgi:hypothetical protein